MTGIISPPGPIGQPGNIKRKWVYNPHIKTFFWDRGFYDRMVNRTLEADDQFIEWCWQHDCNVEKIQVEVPDERTASLFLLKWT